MPRLLELVIAGCLCAILLPVAIICALMVRANLGRPVLFRQVRAGQGGRSITLYKLRTMRDDRDEVGQLLPDQERLTALGRTLRRFRLDEIPQLLAVITGDLALVGPRPLLPATIESFGRSGAERGRVKPGITGWAQVNGNTRLGDAEKLSLDLWYMEHRSTSLDLAILWLTIVTLLRGETRSEQRIRDAHLWRSTHDSDSHHSSNASAGGLL
jgi:lipopolysaccharide/colanic/teichoic acid biosynthesis glycosyltransferase